MSLYNGANDSLFDNLSEVFVPANAKIVPIYTSPGDWMAILRFPYLYNREGEWIGWVTPDRDVFDVNGIFIGQLTDEPRILRRRLNSSSLPRRAMGGHFR